MVNVEVPDLLHVPDITAPEGNINLRLFTNSKVQTEDRSCGLALVISRKNDHT